MIVGALRNSLRGLPTRATALQTRPLIIIP